MSHICIITIMDSFPLIRHSIQSDWEAFCSRISEHRGDELRLRMEVGFTILVEGIEYYIRWSHWRFILTPPPRMLYGFDTAINGTILDSGPCVSLYDMQNIVDRLTIRHIMGA